MLKVLVVDDETVVRRGIALGVERNLAVGSTVNKIVIRHLTDGGG